MKYRVEFGWGDEDQSLTAQVEAPTEAAAQRVAIAMLGEIQVLRVEPDTSPNPPVSAKPDRVQMHPEPIEDDHSRWKRPQA
jgi:hypothetical protein